MMNFLATYITYRLLEGLPFFVYLPLGVLAQKYVRGGYSDPARHGFNWFKAALWLTFAHLAFFVITVIVQHAAPALVLPISHLGAITYLILNFSTYVLLLSIAYLAVGADKVDNQHDSTRFMGRVFINVVRGLLAVSSLLTLITFIFFRYYDGRQLAYSFYGASRLGLSESDWYTARALRWMPLAIDSLLIIVSIYTTVFSVVARNEARKHAVYARTGLPPMRRVWDFLIPATAVTTVTATWALIYDVLGHFYILVLRSRDRFGTALLSGSLLIVDAIISKWVVIAVCVVIYVMGKKREDGLWSVPPTEAEQPQTSATKDEDAHYSV